jgi:RNA polymerase sigma-70 factor, ECF subfamily
MDRERFESLYRAHHDNVLGYVLRRTRPEIADDVVAETFVVAWRRRDTAPAEEPLPWLLGIARRVLANERRAVRRRDAFLGRHAPELVGRAGERPSDPTARSVLQALKQLGERERELLLLVAWEGLTPSQAARVLGETPVTCRVRLHRARRQLARILAERGEEEAATGHAAPLAARQEHG